MVRCTLLADRNEDWSHRLASERRIGAMSAAARNSGSRNVRPLDSSIPARLFAMSGLRRIR